MTISHFTEIKMQLAQITASACSGCSGKGVLSVLFGMVMYLFGEENIAPGVMVIVLVTIDLITALMAEYKNGNPIESRKMLKSTTKITVYALFLAAIHLTEKIVPGSTFLDEAALAYLALTEAVSVMENIGKMGYAMPLKLLNKMQELKETKI